MAAKKRQAATATRPHGNTRNTNASRTNTPPGKTNTDPRTNLMQERFARFYVETRRISESAVRTGYSPQTADSQGSQLLRHPKVAARIAELVNEALEAEGVGRNRFVVDLARRASAVLNTSIADVAEFDSSSLNLCESTSLSALQRLVIKKVTSSPGMAGASQGIKLHDAVPMVALLAKLGGWEAPTKVEAVQHVTTTTVDTSTMPDEQIAEQLQQLLKGT